MKKLVIAMIALMTISTQAQEGRETKRGSQNNKQKEFMQDLTPEEVATLKTKKMTLHLDLTESQQREIKKINLEMAKEQSIKRGERKKKMGQERAKPSKEERLNMMNSRLDKQIETKKQLKRVLTEQQFEKWEKKNQQQKRGLKKRGKRERGEDSGKRKRMN